MAAQEIHQFAECITCHAWSPDHSMIAFCPNNTEVHIYKFIADKWEKLHVLSKHDQIVSGIDWGRSTNKIVTVSHDRNSYVWTQEGQDWVPTLVILKLNRAALCVQWSPKENKFAVGSGAKSVCICYYEQENNWWISKVIRKKHESSVTSLAWHPNNLYGQSRQGSSDTVEPSKPRGGAHENCITCIVPLRKGSESIVKRFSTSGLDGKIVVWDLENHVTITQ
uniref:Uncharacterized protein n=1 Tax=Avena sativa TaxID=4498 RepID=A0ACD5ZDY5_AVESA